MKQTYLRACLRSRLGSIFALILIFVYIVTLGLSARGEMTCVVPTKKIALHSMDTSKKFEIYPGETFRSLESLENNRKLHLRVAHEDFWIRNRDVNVTEMRSCEPDVCVMMSGSDIYYNRPEIGATQSGITGIFKVVSRYKTWYRFKTSYGFGWLKSPQVKHYRVSCTGEVEQMDEVAVQVKEVKPERSREGVYFGVEIGGYPIAKSDAMIRNLSYIPPAGTPVNNDNYNSPLIDQVSDRYGFFIGGNVETPLWGPIRQMLSLGYKYKVISYESMQNSALNAPGTTIDQLVKTTQDLSFQFAYLTFNPRWQGFTLWGLRFQPGVQVMADFLLQKRTIDFLTPPNKTTVQTVQVGFQTVEVFYGPRLDIKFEPFFFAMAQNFHKTYASETELRLGVQF